MKLWSDETYAIQKKDTTGFLGGNWEHWESGELEHLKTSLVYWRGAFEKESPGRYRLRLVKKITEEHLIA